MATTCQRCGGEIINRRRDAKWCSDSCRKAAAREHENKASESDHFWAGLQAIQRRDIADRGRT